MNIGEINPNGCPHPLETLRLLERWPKTSHIKRFIPQIRLPANPFLSDAFTDPHVVLGNAL